MEPTDRTRAVYFTQEEQVVIMNLYEEFKKQLKAKGNTVAHNKAREACWQNIADAVNALGASTTVRTWTQIRNKHKNIIKCANKKKTQTNATGRRSAPPPFTVSEELTLANNEGRPMMAGVAGGSSSDPTASVSDVYVVVEGTTITLREPPAVAFNLQEENDDDETLSARVTMEVVTDNVRALYKRNLELDNEKKLLEIKKLKLEIQLLERQLHGDLNE